MSQFSYEKQWKKRKRTVVGLKVAWQFFKLSQLRDIDLAPVKLDEEDRGVQRGVSPPSLPVEFTQKPSGRSELFDF